MQKAEVMRNFFPFFSGPFSSGNSTKELFCFSLLLMNV